MGYAVSRETLRHLCQLTTIVTVLFGFFEFSQADEGQTATKPFIIAISQIVEHPSLDAVREGLMDTLAEKGYKEGDNLVVLYKNAQGNITTSSQIAYALMANDPLPDVFVAIGTPTAQGAIAAGRKNKIPVVFAAVTDPISSKLVSDLTDHRPLVTGVIDFPPVDEQLDLMKAFYPNLKKVGVIYNSGESNSVSVIKAFKKAAKARGIDVVEGVVSTATDIGLAFRRLHADNIKAIYVPQDNTVISAAPRLVQLSFATNIPVFTSDNGSVKQGAFATRSYQYYAVGQKTAEYAVRIFNGEKAINLPIASPEKTSLYFNVETAKKLGIDIPAGLLNEAIVYPGCELRNPNLF